MANTDTNTTKSKRDRVATHEYLDAQGNEADEEQAYQYKYTLHETNEEFTWDFSKASEDARRMLALFGAKTLATNESSGVRNSDKYSGNAGDQMAAVQERFALIEGGEWTKPSEGGGVGVRVNKDALTEAICRVLVAQGKKTQSDIDGGHKAKIRQKLEEDVKFVRTSRQVPQVADEYSKITGRATASVDALDI